jgi:hypothetical protein
MRDLDEAFGEQGGGLVREAPRPAGCGQFEIALLRCTIPQRPEAAT